jgi:predicted GIY-YIG superfamily endonuclease
MHNEILNQKIHLETKIRDIEDKIKQKTELNSKYINTIIYMIRPKRNNFYMYIGHTTDKARRLKEHIRSTENDNTKLYNTIRETGGWDHWEMIEICSYECTCREDALKIEQQWCEKLRPNLNSTSPFA